MEPSRLHLLSFHQKMVNDRREFSKKEFPSIHQVEPRPKRDWLAKISDPCSSSGTNNLVTSKSRSSSTHSSSRTSVKSLNFLQRSNLSALRVKGLNAQIELKTAQVEADRLKDRIEEKNTTLVLQQQEH